VARLFHLTRQLVKVTDDQNASTDRQNFQFREKIGGIQTYKNPSQFGLASMNYQE